MNKKENKISKITRRDIFQLFLHGIEDGIERNYLPLFGVLTIEQFFQRLYSAKEMIDISTLIQKNNFEYFNEITKSYSIDYSWIFENDLLNLENGKDSFLLNFICEHFHPEVRNERYNWRLFLNAFNELLLPDEYEIYPISQISGRDVFGFRKVFQEEKLIKLTKSMQLNTTFDTYTLCDQLGEGGSGKVYSALSSVGVEYAVKTITVKNGVNKTPKDKIKRFKNEMYFCLRNQHKNIINIEDYGITSDKNTYFYVMKKYDFTMRKLLASGIPDSSKIKYFLDLCDGLKYAHSLNCFHRDLKPENILYDSDNDALILSDFGAAHFVEEIKITEVQTKNSDRLANFDYYAPEQRKGNLVNSPSADIYALGLLLNEMFSGKIPKGTKYKTIEDSNYRYAFLDKLVEKMIRQDPKQRFESIDEILVEFLYLCAKYSQVDKKLKLNIDKELLYSFLCTKENVIREFAENSNFCTNIVSCLVNGVLCNTHLESYAVLSMILIEAEKWSYLHKDSFSEYMTILKFVLVIVCEEQVNLAPQFFKLLLSQIFNKVSTLISEKKERGRLTMQAIYGNSIKKIFPIIILFG